MKLLFIFAVVLTTAFGFSEDVVPKFNMDSVLLPEDSQQLEKLLGKELGSNERKENNVLITVLLNEWIDKLLGNVRNLIVESGMDSIALPDQKVNIKVGHTTLVEGQLNDTSTIERYENATITYDKDSKQLKIHMTLRFEDLKFIYKYHTKVTFISMTGHVHGQVEHIHINVGVGIDLNTYMLAVDYINFKHTGSISLKFTGIGMIDWITNSMSTVLSTVLHDLILSIIKDVVAGPINAVVDVVNHFLHPTSLLF